MTYNTSDEGALSLDLHCHALIALCRCWRQQSEPDRGHSPEQSDGLSVRRSLAAVMPASMEPVLLLLQRHAARMGRSYRVRSGRVQGRHIRVRVFAVVLCLA
jgi:hypothetical protein